MASIPKEKTCKVCKKTKLLEEFVKNSDMKDGYINKCKECQRIYLKERRKIRKSNKTVSDDEKEKESGNLDEKKLPVSALEPEEKSQEQPKQTSMKKIIEEHEKMIEEQEKTLKHFRELTEKLKAAEAESINKS